MKEKKQIFKVLMINFIFFTFLLELVSIGFIKSQQSHIKGYKNIPTYLDVILDDKKTFKYTLNGLDTSSVVDPISPHVIDTLYRWCTWHPKNSVNRLKSECFDEIYKYNEMGTRGALPDSLNPSTILFVGDSFVEGYGLNEDSTISERIGQRLDKQVLNLGTSGDFGSTQMSLVYAEFAKTFSHNDVYVLLYLANDFLDNNINNHPPNRYRPYRIISDESTEITYRGTVDSSHFTWEYFKQVKERELAIKKRLFPSTDGTLTKLSRLSYTRRLFSFLKENQNNNNTRPYELTYSNTDWKILEGDIASIFESASKQNASVTFINLPSKLLLHHIQKSTEIKEEYEELERELENVIKIKKGRYLSFFDYLVARNAYSIFLTCDNHYSNKGESLLSDFIYTSYEK